jgi:hypothetical protein
MNRRSALTGACFALLLFAVAQATAQSPAQTPPPTTSAAEVEIEVDAPPGTAAAGKDEIVVERNGEIDAAATAFARMDSDRDGQLSLREFEKGIASPRGYDGSGGVVYQRLPARFRALDGDASGYLEEVEFATFVQRWNGPGAAPALPASDRDGDGRLDFREFVALLAPR